MGVVVLMRVFAKYFQFILYLSLWILIWTGLPKFDTHSEDWLCLNYFQFFALVDKARCWAPQLVTQSQEIQTKKWETEFTKFPLFNLHYSRKKVENYLNIHIIILINLHSYTCSCCITQCFRHKDFRLSVNSFVSWTIASSFYWHLRNVAAVRRGQHRRTGSLIKKGL